MATLQDQRAQLEAAQKEMRESRAWFKFLEAHSAEILPCEANLESARRYFGQRPDDPGAAQGEELSFESLEESWQNPAFRQMLALRTEGDERLSLCQGILALVPASNHQHYIMKFKHTTTADLRVMLANLQSHKEVSQLPIEQVRKLAKPVVQEESSIPPEFNRRRILSMSADELTRFLRRYDSNADKDEIVRRLNDRSNG